MTLDIRLNGEPRQVATGTTLLQLLGTLDLDPGRVAIEFNRAIVRRPEWASTTVQAGAEIEVVMFVGGG